jgi:hypothetical protein
MTVKSRPSEQLPDWAIEEPVRDLCHPKWVRTGWMWGPECPIEPGHGAMVDLKGGGWYCRHQYHDIDSTRTSWTDESLKDLAYERALRAWQERSKADQPTE